MPRPRLRFAAFVIEFAALSCLDHDLLGFIEQSSAALILQGFAWPVQDGQAARGVCWAAAGPGCRGGGALVVAGEIAAWSARAS